MKTYSEYLYKLGFSSATIKQYSQLLILFTTWLNQTSLLAENCTYKDMIRFIDDALVYFHNRKNPKSTANRMMISISYYYDYLIITKPEIHNPAKTIRIKNPVKRIVHNLLSEQELVSIYNSIDTFDARSTRNKVLLGFLVYQGLATRELHRLYLDDLKLRKGTVFIKGDKAKQRKRGSTSRELKLEALQIIDLLEYIKEVRPRILAGSYRYLPGRKPTKENFTRETNQLLLSIGGSLDLKNSMIHLFKNLQKHNPRIKNAKQIRQSVIASWITKENLRKVQYFAGHRYVSSTEYYKQIDFKELKRKVCDYHPLV